jgi:hypothetical protein
MTPVGAHTLNWTSGLNPVQHGVSRWNVPVPPTPPSQYDPANDAFAKTPFTSSSVPTIGVVDAAPTLSES